VTRVVVIGAGVGGLTTAAVLAKAGVDVTVLEAHIYPGGCAGSFYHQGYRFDAGATLAGGYYTGGPMDLVAKAAGIHSWGVQPCDPTMVVHLPNGIHIPRWSDERRWSARQAAFGTGSEAFFRWQESTADALWDLTLRGIPWPPQSPQELWDLVRKGFSWMGGNPMAHLKPGLLADAARPIAAHLRNAKDPLRLFIDAQLLISAQTTSKRTNALYGASALDLPRRGAVHLTGGMGAISSRLAQAVEVHGGQVLYRKRVNKVTLHGTKPLTIEFQRGDPFMADAVIFNLPPWNIAKLLAPPLPRALKILPRKPARGWGAFMVYLGVEGTAIPEGFPPHHQIILGRPLAEGNSIFLSINPAWDTQRAPQGKRAITISTHTDPWPWWQLHDHDEAGYHRQREQLRQKILTAVEGILPGISTAADLILDGTPVTFERFTGRISGWVGGFPQVDLFQGKAPRLEKTLWMVGDSIFPGQSTAAVALGGLRVAASVLTHLVKNGNQGEG
jgi:C-3',4' desaturase CrtD